MNNPAAIFYQLAAQFFSADPKKRRSSQTPSSRLSGLECFEPRVMLSGVAAPVSTDLAVAVSSNAVAAVQGSEIIYDIAVTNNGPSAVTDAQVLDAVSSFLDSASWTATFAGGASGNANGSGDLNETVVLPAGASIEYVLTGTLKESARGTVTNVVSINSPSNTDTAPENNSAGDSDLVVLKATTGSGLFELSDQSEQGGFVTPGDGGFFEVQLADLDNDGDQDIITARDSISGPGTDHILLFLENNGEGVFTIQGPIINFGYLETFEIGDFNGDGLFDVLTVENELITLWIGDGEFNFSRRWQESSGLDGDYINLTAGDVDSDGDLDLVYSDEFTSLYTMLNDGAGEFTQSFEFAGGSTYIVDMQLGDLDGDGDLDLVISTNSSRTYRFIDETLMFINNGKGEFAQNSPSFITREVRGFDLGDVDGDGDLDLLVAQRDDNGGDFSTLFLNDGSGIFETNRDLQPANQTYDVSFADFDADGDLDVVFSKRGSSTFDPDTLGNEVFLNDGLGNFSTTGTHYPGIGSYKHAIGDLNGDGALDFVSTRGEVWFNTNKVLLPYEHDFEGIQGGLQHLQLSSPATSTVIGNEVNHFLKFDNSRQRGISMATMETLEPLPADFILKANVSTSGGFGALRNGFLVFDYQNENDFKYAGMIGETNQWVIGHYQGTWSNRFSQVDWDDSGKVIQSNKSYQLELQVVGKEVRLLVDGKLVTSAKIASPLNDGLTGIASLNAISRFDNLKLREVGPYFLDYYEDFNSPFPTQFQFNNLLKVSVVQGDENGYLKVDTSGSSGLGVALHPNHDPLPEIWKVEADVKAISGPNRWQDGFLIFDYKNANDFKYAGMFNGQNEWVVGHYQGNWGNRLLTVDGDDFGWEIKANVAYHMEVEAVGKIATFSVNGVVMGSVEFATNLNGGRIGLGAYNAVTHFDDFRLFLKNSSGSIQSLPYQLDLSDISLEELSSTGSVTIVNGIPNAPHNFDVSVEITNEEGREGGIIFDYQDADNYKFALLDFDRGRVSISAVVDGNAPRINLADGIIPGFFIETGSKVNLHLSVRGSIIEAFVDQLKMLEYEFEESNMSDGQLGLISKPSVVAYSNFEVHEEMEPRGEIDPSFYFDFDYWDSNHISDWLHTDSMDHWSRVKNGSNGIAEANSLSDSPLATALIQPINNLPSSFEMSIEITPLSQPGGWQDGFLIFDYKSPTDFKYAGMMAGQNQWIIGHFNGGFGNRELTVDWDDIGRQINPDELYLLHVSIDGSEVQLRVDTELIGTANFDAPVNEGQLGFGNYNAKTWFDEFRVGNNLVQGDVVAFPYSNNLSDYYQDRNNLPFLELNKESSNYYQSNKTLIFDATSENSLGAFILPTEDPLPVNYHVGVEFLSRDDPQPFRTGFVIFDYKNENDFKFAGALVSQNRWVIGHYQGHFANRLADVDWSAEDREILSKKYYEIAVNVHGADVELLVDGESIAEVTFSEPVNNGAVGFGVKGSRNYFRNFIAEEIAPPASAIDSLFSNMESEGSAILA
ncbi:FG-GAP repeat protein [Polystyrenella longa]|uniref:FG-GAP repeat protein n=1 Tax=Polystyrenella longa TaxID=2528007 RepID=A0A518CP41_9PLAN|nr:FG-GAP-like repeat-containing protein [Polystyrenella longa]QDU80996.1 FG-GAP repeat protein [Polystyrenella longa]